MIYNQRSINPIAQYVADMFNKHQADMPFLMYHNLSHTQNVVLRTNEICSFYAVNGVKLFVVLSAAWFHDCGHLFGSPIDHEQRGALKMKEYMEQTEMSPEIIDDIQSCILATRLPGNPKTLLEKILCDADLYHFGTDEFFHCDMLVKKELEMRNNLVLKNWDDNSLSLLKNHRFHTEYCRNLLEAGKQKNIATLRDKIDRRN